MGFFNREKAVATVAEFEEFKEQYTSAMKYAKKTYQMCLDNPDDLDEAELYGLGVTMMKKAFDLSDAAMELLKWQCETLKSIDERLEKLENK